MDSVITKFKIGDFVKYIKTEEEGKIVDIVSTLGGDDNVYEVEFNGCTRLYAEKYLELVMASKEIVVEEEKSVEVKEEPIEIKEEVKEEKQSPKKSNKEKDIIKAINVEDVDLSIKIEDEINRIIKEQGLVQVNNDTDSLMNACKLLKYLATRENNINHDECKTNSIVLICTMDLMASPAPEGLIISRAI